MMIMTTMTMEIYILFYFMLAQASHNHSHRLFSFTSYFVEFVQKYTYFSSYFYRTQVSLGSGLWVPASVHTTAL